MYHISERTSLLTSLQPAIPRSGPPTGQSGSREMHTLSGVVVLDTFDSASLVTAEDRSKRRDSGYGSSSTLPDVAHKRDVKWMQNEKVRSRSPRRKKSTHDWQGGRRQCSVSLLDRQQVLRHDDHPRDRCRKKSSLGPQMPLSLGSVDHTPGLGSSKARRGSQDPSSKGPGCNWTRQPGAKRLYQRGDVGVFYIKSTAKADKRPHSPRVESPPLSPRTRPADQVVVVGADAASTKHDLEANQHVSRVRSPRRRWNGPPSPSPLRMWAVVVACVLLVSTWFGLQYAMLVRG